MKLRFILASLSLIAACTFSKTAQAQFPTNAPQDFGGWTNNAASNSFPSWTNSVSAAIPQIQVPPPSALNAPATTTRNDWSLGAYVRNLNTGVQITDVVNGSAAQKLGLKRNDVIVAVSGYQVGYVGTRLYDVTEEIRKRVDPTTGKVAVLILDVSDRNLKNITVDMNAVESALAGAISMRDNTFLSSDAVMEVQIKNVSKPYQEVFGGRSLTRISGNGPFPFTIRFDPNYIDARDQYQLQTTISINGQPTYYGSQPIPAPAAGRVTNVSMAIDRIGVVQAGGTTTQVGYPPDQNAIRQIFNQYLGREPLQSEMQAWMDFLSKGRSLDEARISLLASTQFYELAFNDPTKFIQRLYMVHNRQPTAGDYQRWMARYQQVQGTRTIIAKEFLESIR